MTREEAKYQMFEDDNNWFNTDVRKSEWIIDKIFDDFEEYKLELSKAYADNLLEMKSRTCESCSWFSEDENGYVCNQEHQIYTYDDRRADGYLSPDKDFGCNKFEPNV